MSQRTRLISLKGHGDGEPRVCFLITMLPHVLTWLEMPHFFLLNLDLKVKVPGTPECLRQGSTYFLLLGRSMLEVKLKPEGCWVRGIRASELDG